MVKISEGKKGGGQFFLEAIERLNITEGGSLIISYLSLCRREWGGGGCLFEAGRLITFSALRMGAYSRLGAYWNKYGKFQTQCITNIIFMFFFRFVM